MVAAGATDGYVSAVSTGAVKRGDWASIIGTTMVLKGVTKELFVDAGGSSYSHKLLRGLDVWRRLQYWGKVSE